MGSLITSSAFGGDCAPPPLFPSPLPGPKGDDGSNGTGGSNGTNGINAFSTLTSPFNQVASGNTVTASVGSTAWMAVGQAVFVATSGYFTVTTITNATTVVLTMLAAGMIASIGTAIAAGSGVVPGGYANVDNSQYTSLAASVTTLQGLIGSGSVKTSFQGTAPSSPNVGDLWFNSANNNQIEMWTGSAWVVVSSTPTIINQYNSTQGIQPVQIVTTMPGSPTTGQLALYQGSPGTFVPHTLYTWTGAAWVPVITTITPSMITTGLITAGMIQAGAITASAVGANQIITSAANIALAIINDALISNVSAGKIISGTIQAANTLTLGTSGGNGIIQSANYVSGSAGFAIKGDGSAEFSNIVVRGTLSTGTISNAVQIFNPGAAANLMNSVASATGSASPGASSMGSGLFYSLVSFFGWASGLGTSNTRFGKSTMTFLCAANYAYTLAGANQAVTNIVYRVNGGSWQNVNPWAVATVGPKSGDSISYAVQISGLTGTEQIDFGTKHADSNSGDTINVTNLSVTALNF